MSQAVNARLMKARWAYSEIASDRFGHDYNGYEPIEPIRQKARIGGSFEDLDQSEIDHLAFVHEGVRGRFIGKYIDFSEFHETSLDKAAFTEIFVMPEISASWPMSFIEWAIRSIKERSAIIETLMHVPLRSFGLSTMPPAVAGVFEDKIVLVDGYIRGMIFLRDADADATFRIYVPLRV